MTDFGVTSAGFVPKTVDDIIGEINADMLSAIDATLDLSPDLPMGQVIGIFAKYLADQWTLLGDAYGSMDRTNAEFFLLDNLGTLTGTPRLPALESTVRLSCVLVAGTILVEGEATANVTGHADDTWVAAETYTAVTSGAHDVLFRATTVGPRAAVAPAIAVITVPVTGWTSVTQAADADVGRLVETDAAYRVRQVAELAQGGSSSVVAVRAALLQIPLMREAFVYENTGDTVDDLGVPPHSVYPVIWDGNSMAVDDDVIAQALWANKGGGIDFYGSSSGIASDVDGGRHTVHFDRASGQDLYLAITVSVNSHYPADGSSQVKTAILAKATDVLTVGADVIALTLRSAALTVAGVLDAPVFHLKLGSAPSSSPGVDVDNIEITPTQIAQASFIHIAVTVVVV